MLLGGHATSLLRWHRHLPQLREVLRKAEFVALDLELTGLHARAEKFLGVDQCYAAHTEGARSFMPVQLGLCAARRSVMRDEQAERRSTSSEALKADAYTTLRGQKAYGNSCPDGRSLMLRLCGPQLNQVLRPRCAQEENEERATLVRRIEELRSLQTRGSLENSRALYFTEAEPLPSLLLSRFVAAASALQRSPQPLRACVCPPEASPPVSNAMPVSVFEAATEEDRLLADSVRRAIKDWSTTNPEEPLELPISSPLQRLLLHSLVAAEFPHLFSNSCTRGEQRIFVVYSVCAVKLTSGASGCTCASCYRDLPEGVAEFKKNWSQLFPCTFDTKLLAETHETLMPLATPATLKDLCELMVGASVSARAGGRPSGQPTFEVEALEGTTWKFDACLSSVIESGDASQAGAAAAAELAKDAVMPQQDLRSEAEDEAASSEYAHDAGYDSLMTTMVFLMQVGHVVQQRGLSWESLHFRLVRTQPPSINLGGKDDQNQQQQKRLLLMRNFPPNWQKWNIMKLWSPVWVDVQPIDTSACWLATRTEEDARSLLTIYEMMPSKDFEWVVRFPAFNRFLLRGAQESFESAFMLKPVK
ncbi:hypothetical protein ACSSS7_002326 [Eimeria intestinalis]